MSDIVQAGIGMPMQSAPRARRGPSLALALLLAAATLTLYVVFNYYRMGDLLYAWSKTLASYDYRQYLVMSKRWAMQYGHLVFLFSLLLLSRYIFIWDQVHPRLSKAIAVAMPYTIPIFIIHFPLLYFFAAITGHDPQNPLHEGRLLVLVLVTSVLFGVVCQRFKPLFDGLTDRLLAFVSSQRPAGDNTGASPLTISRSHSEFLKVVRFVATLSIAFGHYNFDQFSSFEIPGFDHWRRWAVPFFFMISGYFAMLSVDRSSGSALYDVVRRGTGIWYLALPMLLIVPLLDHIGFQADSWLYFLHSKFVSEEAGGPADLATYLITLVNSMLFLNESWIYKLMGLGLHQTGLRAFSNDSYWFLCYLIPFTVMMIVMRKVAGWQKYLWLFLLVAVFGPPMMMLAPLFFAGCLAYLIHKRY